MNSPSVFNPYIEDWKTAVPATTAAVHLEETGLRGVFFDSVPFKGRTTRVFAWIGLPEKATADQPVPAMVLIHGGGGTAFARWVRWWNLRGYAAIAMDTCGAMPLQDTGTSGGADWPRHSLGGPPGWGGFDQTGWPAEDQWPFHAAAAIIKSATLLASIPGVDADRIGVTGISWGGYLTCLAAGLDSRWKCAIPVYGCGFLDESPVAERLKANDPEAQRLWQDRWDPAGLLPRTACPMFWLNGTNDFAFSPPMWQRSAAASRGPRTLCMKLRYPHGHMPEAEQAAEIGAFADAHLNSGSPLTSLGPVVYKNGILSTPFRTTRTLHSATLLVTPDRDCPWPARQWHMLSAAIDKTQQRITAPLPEPVAAACLSVVDSDWLTVTSDLYFC